MSCFPTHNGKRYNSLNELKDHLKSMSEKKVKNIIYNFNSKQDIEGFRESVALKQGVQELFESNPELANAVYEALGFKNNIDLIEKADTDSRGNVGIGYSILQDNNVVGEIILNEFKDHPIDNSYSIAFSKVETPGKSIGTNAYIKLNSILNKRGKKLVSDTSRTDAAESLWASFEKKGLAKKIQIGKAKVKTEGSSRFRIDTSPKRSDYVYEFIGESSEITPQQKQQAQQLYSQYLEQNPNGSVEGFKSWVDNRNNFDKELAQKIQDKLQKLYPEIKLNIINNPLWREGDNIFNQLIQDDYFEGNPKYFTEIERISNLILNKLKFKTKEFNGKYNESITDLQTYKTKVLNDLLKNIGITGNVTNLNELKERLNSKELQTSLKENLEQVKESKENFKNQLDDFYHTKRLLNNYLKHFDLSKYNSSQQARIKQYLPSLFKDNKFKSDKQAIAFNKRRINSEEWANKVFNLDKITLGFLSNNAREKKIETLLNYFKIEPKDAAERIYVTIENELNRRERFFTSEKTQAKINAKIAEEKIKLDNEKAERERIRTKELNKFKESTVVSEVEGIIGGRNIHSLEKVLESESINEELAIIKNNGYSLDKTPNGKKSNLYQSILALPEVNGNTEIANKLKSLVYSNNFTNLFGDWINNPEESSKIVDENGEPKLVYHGSGREYNKFSEEKRGSATGKWKDRLSDSEMSFMFTDNPSVAFYYAIIERQQILAEILYYVRKAGQEPTQQLITEMYEKYPSIKHWVNSLKEKGLGKTEILEEFKRIYREYSEIRELSEGGAIGNSNSYLNNMRTAISYLQENKSKILKNGFSKDIGKSTVAKVQGLKKYNTVFFNSSKEYRTSYILADGRLTGFEDKSLNDKNIKDLSSEEYDKIVLQFQEDYVYLYNKIEDELKAGGFQPKIYPVFLNAKSVNSKDFKGRPFMFQQGDTEELVKKRKSKGAAFEVADLVEEALNSGLDGSIIENIADPNVGTNYSVFKANQIKSLFNDGEYSSKNDSFYNQLVNDRIVGQANIKAMSVLIDAINQKQDTLPHEYAHHYIAWYRNTPIVQEAIKKWGSEEALVQSIGEQVVKQEGEAYNWWNNFVKWIMNQFNSLSKLQKEELTQILTDAFLTRQDLNNIGDNSFQQFQQSLNKPNTNPILKGNQEEQVKKFDELQERLNNKEFLDGAKNAFESSKGLQKWGTQEQYTNYIARVSLGIVKNPTSGGYNYKSQVKDVVYHGTKLNEVRTVFDKETIQKTGVSLGKGFFFSRRKDYVERDVYGFKKIGSYLLNITNPINGKPDKFLIENDFDRVPNKNKSEIKDDYLGDNGERIYTTHRDINFESDEERTKVLQQLGYDAVDFNKGEYSNEIVVFEPEQIHILGGKQDAEGFRESVQDLNNVGNNSSQREDLDLIEENLFSNDNENLKSPCNGGISI